MILPTGKTVRITSCNPNRCYLLIQNIDTTNTNYIYLMQEQAEAEVMLAQGVVIGGTGFIEMQNCNNMQSKKEWFAYTEVSGMDIRVKDV